MRETAAPTRFSTLGTSTFWESTPHLRPGMVLLLLLATAAAPSPPCSAGESLGAGPRSDWWNSAQQNIAALEYEVTWQNATDLSDVPAA